MADMRDRLIELNGKIRDNYLRYARWKDFDVYLADNLLANGVILPPCKVGDTVYSKDGKSAEIEELMIDKRSIVAHVHFECDYNCDDCAFNSWHTDYSGENSCDGEYGNAMVSVDEIGKTVFLTREEAEKALREKDE